MGISFTRDQKDTIVWTVIYSNLKKDRLNIILRVEYQEEYDKFIIVDFLIFVFYSMTKRKYRNTMKLKWEIKLFEMSDLRRFIEI